MSERYAQDSYKKAFRVRGLPHRRKIKEAEHIIKTALKLKDDDHGLKICSVAFNCYRSGGERVATISFSKVPIILSNDKGVEEWRVLIPGSELPHDVDTDGHEVKGEGIFRGEVEIVFDTHFRGFTPLRSFQEPAYHEVDCIAISGLGGHAFGSFKERGGVHMWLRDSLPAKLPSARILTYGYDTRLEASQSFQDVRSLAGQFRTHIRAIRGNSNHQNSPIPLLFIAHSLGGLVLKQALIQMSEGDDLDIANLKATYAILFFGVPSKGMDISSLVPIVENQPNREFLDSLSQDSQLLEDQTVEFPKAFSFTDSEIISFYETMKSPTAEKYGDSWRMTGCPAVLVDVLSATHGRPWELKDRYVLGINRTHSEMVKFSRLDIDYEMVLHHLQRFHIQAVEIILDRFQAESASMSIEKIPETQVWMPEALTEEQERLNQACLISLAFPEMSDREHDIVSQYGETCTWILSHEKFITWLEKECGLFWIRGKPGAGKSTLLKYTLQEVKHLEFPHKRVLIISHFFHGRGAEIQKGPLGLFRSLLHQLLKSAPEMLSELTDIFQMKIKTQGEPDKGWKWHPLELQRVLENSILEVGKVYKLQVFVDALDECGESEAVRLVEYFQRLISVPNEAGRSISICFSCRHYPILTLERGFEICVEDENQDDIKLYIRDKLRRSIQDEAKAHTIEEEIMDRASGTFQWVVLVVSQVCDLHRRGKSLKVIQTHIRKIPPKLNDLYHQMLQEIKEESASQSLHIMQWICFAIRPLTLDELRYAMIVDADTPHKSLAECQGLQDYVETEEEMERVLKDLCRGLAEVKHHEGKRVVQFIHQSVNDFFLQDGLRILDPSWESNDIAIGRAHFRLSRSCIKYFSMEELSCQVDSMATTTHFHYGNRKILEKVNFLKYAAKSWFQHAQAVEVRTIPQDDLLSLFQWPSNQMTNRWILIDKAFKYKSDFALDAGLFHIASATPLVSVLKAIIRAGVNIDIKCSHNRTPLFYAAAAGNEHIVNLLLSAGAEVESLDLNCRTPLMYALRGDYKRTLESTVKALLAAGANVESQDSDGWTPLIHAIRYADESKVKALLAAGANVESQDSRGWTPLIHAIRYADESISKALLAAGANVESQDSRGWTPLFHAIRYADKSKVKALLAAGANVESQDSDGWTPLIHAIRYADESISKALLAAGANVESQDSCGWTPLIYAIRYADKSKVKALLAAGANVESQDSDGWTPLMHAVRYADESIPKALLAAGANMLSQRFSLLDTAYAWC